MKATQLRRGNKFRKIFKNTAERAEYISRRPHMIPEIPGRRVRMCTRVGSNVISRSKRTLSKRTGLPSFQNRVRKPPLFRKIYHKVEHRHGNGRIPQRRMFTRGKMRSVAKNRRYVMRTYFNEKDFATGNSWMFVRSHTVTYNNPSQYHISKEKYKEFTSHLLFEMLKDPDILKGQPLIEYFPELEKNMCKDGFLGHYDFYTLKYCKDAELINQIIEKWIES